MTTPRDVLRGAREFLAQPEKWTKGAGARSIGGYVVSVASEEASCFCVAGALARAAGLTTLWLPGEIEKAGSRAYYAALRALAGEVRRRAHASLPPGDLDAVGAWNDAPATTIDDVISTLADAEDAVTSTTTEAVAA